ncbi:glycosyltransferase [Isosphaeraceae bacterium EP7]
MLVIHRGLSSGSPEGHQVQGFEIFRDDFLRRLNVEVVMVEALTLGEIERAYDANPSDVALVMISWRETAEDAAAFFRGLSEKPGRGKIIFLDYYAPTSTPHFGVLPHVDRFAKRQVLKDRSAYQRDYDGGLLFTDFLSKELGYELNGWNFSSKPDPDQVHKVKSCWNLSTTRKYMNLLSVTRPLRAAWNLRPIVLNRRIGKININAHKEWYQQYRELALEKMEPLTRRYRSTGNGPIPARRYLMEMMMCKIVVSPFGWGELCFRDYETVAAGALLIKPSMEHLVTSPDIFKPNETYVPIRWDLTDLVEVCEHYLSHPDEARRIIKNAQDVLHDYYHGDGFVNDVGRIIDFGEADVEGATTSA